MFLTQAVYILLTQAVYTFDTGCIYLPLIAFLEVALSRLHTQSILGGALEFYKLAPCVVASTRNNHEIETDAVLVIRARIS